MGRVGLDAVGRVGLGAMERVGLYAVERVGLGAEVHSSVSQTVCRGRFAGVPPIF